MSTKNWIIFTGESTPHDRIESEHPAIPPWRQFDGQVDKEYEALLDKMRKTPSRELERRGKKFLVTAEEIIRMVNAALYLRRPLLISGEPGSGKSSLLYAVAYELKLGEVLKWSITSRSNLKDALYQYDAIGRLHKHQLQKERGGDREDDGSGSGIGDYIRLGPLGTALLPTRRPRALLIDDIGKSDFDLPNDLLHVFEEGEFNISELERYKDLAKDKDTDFTEVPVKDYHGHTVKIRDGRIKCNEFPFVIITNNGEREFPASFLRRCLQFEMPKPIEKLGEIVRKQFEDAPEIYEQAEPVIEKFLDKIKAGDRKLLTTDQLLNAIYMVKGGHGIVPGEEDKFIDDILKPLPPVA